jgi:hypothetical protein
VVQLAATINGQGESPERKAIFNYVRARAREVGLEAQHAGQPLVYSPEMEELREWVRRHYYPDSPPITPELLEWARRTFNEEEFLAGLREIETTGGLELKDFIHELEPIVKSHP